MKPQAQDKLIISKITESISQAFKGFTERESEICIKTEQETRARLITKAKTFNGLINNEDDLFEHLARVQRCDNCKKDFYDKLCPACWQKKLEDERARLRQEIEKYVNKRREDLSDFDGLMEVALQKAEVTAFWNHLKVLLGTGDKNDK